MKNKKLEAGLKYQKLGWSIIPVNRDKKPYVEWKEFQTTPPTSDQIIQWLADFPDCNLAVVTGKVSNLVVLDFDNLKTPQDLQKTFKTKLGNKLSNTIIQRSGNGWHVFFRYPKGEDLKTYPKMVPNVDIKAEGGLVTIYPSIHSSKKRYKWWIKTSPLEHDLKYLKNIPAIVLESIIITLGLQEPELEIPKPQLIVGRDMLKKVHPEPKWIVPGVLSAGLTILAGKPKVGKSVFALNILMAMAYGKEVFGKFKMKKGKCIYLALDEGDKALQDRVKSMIKTSSEFKTDSPFIDNLLTTSEWIRMDEGGISLLEEQIKEYEPNLIVIDVLEAFRPATTPKGKSQYQVDYNDMVKIKKLAHSYNVDILALHHLIKSKAEDTHDMIAGSTGLVGGADGQLVLYEKSNKQIILDVRSKHFEAKRYVMERHNLKWKISGLERDVKSTTNKQAVYDVIVSAGGRPITTKEIIDQTGLERDVINKLIYTMKKEGDIRSVGRGVFELKDEFE